MQRRGASGSPDSLPVGVAKPHEGQPDGAQPLPASQTQIGGLSRRHAALGALAVAAATLAILLATSPPLPMAWDEGNAIRRAEAVTQWFVEVWQRPPGSTPLAAARLETGWPYTTQIEGHPAFYGLAIAAGQAIGGRWLAPLAAARLGPMTLFALAAGAMFYRLARNYSLPAALGGVLALLTLPRMFGHAHFASFDGPLTAGWIAAWATFWPATRTLPTHGLLLRSLLWGAVLGVALSCKFTAWAMLAPLLLWTLVYRSAAAARCLAIGLPAALAVFIVLNPPLWHHPLDGLLRFFHLNLHRADQPDLNISILFLGELYNLDFPLPWYNTLFWTAIVVPIGSLGLAAVGLAWAVRSARSDPPAMLAVLLWAVLIVIRALPGTPPHDGIRLFLPAFAMLAVLAGLGCHALAAGRGKWRRLGRTLAALALAGSATSTIWYAPQWLSHYNLLIGGLRGAQRAGMEPTYYWDAFDLVALDWLHAHTADGEKIYFASGAASNLELLRRWGVLQRDFDEPSPGAFRWCVVQSRPGAWIAPEQWLIDHAQPVFTRQVRTSGWGPWQLDTPLLRVYAYADYRAALQATAEPR